MLKSIKNIFFVLLLLCFTSSVFAVSATNANIKEDDGEISAYFGLGLGLNTSCSYDDIVIKKFTITTELKKNYITENWFFGVDFYKDFAVEFGYINSISDSQIKLFNDIQEHVLNFDLNSKTLYMDFIPKGYLDSERRQAILFIFGIHGTTIKTVCKAVYPDEEVILANEISTINNKLNNINLYKAKTPGYRTGIGFGYDITDNLNLRSTFIYQFAVYRGGDYDDLSFYYDSLGLNLQLSYNFI